MAKDIKTTIAKTKERFAAKQTDALKEFYIRNRKVSYDEFAALEQRVIAVESKMAKVN